MNPTGSTICLLGTKSTTFLKIIYPLYQFLEAHIVDRVKTNNGAGFTTRDALSNYDVNGLNVISLFLQGEGFLNKDLPSWLGRAITAEGLG